MILQFYRKHQQKFTCQLKVQIYKLGWIGTEHDSFSNELYG